LPPVLNIRRLSIEPSIVSRQIHPVVRTGLAVCAHAQWMHKACSAHARTAQGFARIVHSELAVCARSEIKQVCTNCVRSIVAIFLFDQNGMYLFQQLLVGHHPIPCLWRRNLNLSTCRARKFILSPVSVCDITSCPSILKRAPTLCVVIELPY